MEGQEKVDSFVKLNVGGMQFRTTIDTLMKGDTMLSAMFSGRMPLKRDDDGSVFIDRDGRHFRAILNFLRDGHVLLPDKRKELEGLKIEANFYCINQLAEICDNQDYVELNVGGVIFSTSRETLLKEESKLALMCSGKIPIIRDNRGLIFIDRNPEHFGRILEFLRDEGTLYDLSPDVRDDLRREAEYYGIDGLLEIIWNIRNSIK